MKRLFFFIILTVALSSCSTTYEETYSRQILNSYIGLTHQQIVKQLGAPVADMTDGGDGYILVYEGNRELFSYPEQYVAKSSTLPKAQFFMNA